MPIDLLKQLDAAAELGKRHNAEPWLDKLLRAYTVACLEVDHAAVAAELRRLQAIEKAARQLDFTMTDSWNLCSSEAIVSGSELGKALAQLGARP